MQGELELLARLVDVTPKPCDRPDTGVIPGHEESVVERTRDVVQSVEHGAGLIEPGLGQRRDTRHLQAIRDRPGVIDVATERDAVLECDASLFGIEPELGIAPSVQRPRLSTGRRRSPPSRGLRAPVA